MTQTEVVRTGQISENILKTTEYAERLCGGNERVKNNFKVWDLSKNMERVATYKNATH